MRIHILALSLIAAASAHAYDADKPILARNPTLSASQIAFEFGTDLWIVPREGGRARRITFGPGIESNPYFSPDGKWIAFNGEYDGNQDVFIVPVEGGNPKRLTYHPAPDEVRGWSPDGKSILFGSPFEQSNGQNRLYTVPATGGWPQALPLPRGSAGSFSPDGSKIAYTPHDLWQAEWKQMKGGQTTPIWIANLADSKIEKVPRDNSIDRSPMWIGNEIYFISNRNGRATLYSYGVGSKKISMLLKPEDLDVKSASAGPGAIVFERLGSLHLYDLSSKTQKKVPIQIEDDMLEVRPAYKSVANMVNGADLSPSGVRAVFEARGDIFTVPVEKGDARNLTQSSGVAERSPVWSPDGQKIAYLSDASGNYELHVANQMDGSQPVSYKLSEKPTWYHGLTWSPDSKKLMYIDQSLRIYTLNLETKKFTEFDREPFYFFGDSMSPAWSPDSKWIVYTKRLRNKISAVFVYSMESGKITQVTDGLSDASSAAFDRGGRFIYFLASTDVAQSISVGGMSSMAHPVTSSAYVIVLRNTDTSPLSPESDEERAGTAPGGPPSPPDTAVKIDFDGISQRILALPLPAANYAGLVAATPGSILVLRGAPIPGFGTPGSTLLRFSFQGRATMPIGQGIFGLTVNAKGDKALVQGMGGIQIVPTMAPIQPGQGAVDTSGLQALVDPRAEWRQMFFEIWRNERDFLYDPNTHGVDISKAIQRYEPYLENLSSRQDFNYMMQDMLNEVSIGHTFSGGGDLPSGTFVPGGLLGADYKIENGRYRFSRIYNGENWNPNLRAPLTQPGATVKAGEYLLAVNGRELTDKQNVFEAFENTANKQVRIKVGATPDGAGSREITVVPVGSEGALRNRAWVEDNRRKVQEMSGGKIAYIYIPDTGGGGFASFNRYFTAQLDKDSVLIDERFNQGGALSDYIVQILSRKVLGNANQRDNEDFPIPMFVNEGPKAMLINEMAGSGGDAMPWFFRTGKVGKLIGKRTWGGLVAAGQGVPLMGGGFHTSPQVAIYGLNGEWEVENHGVAPDIEVEEDPAMWRAGRDPQLEVAVAHLLDQLKKNPARKYQKPKYPDYQKGDPLGKSGG